MDIHSTLVFAHNSYSGKSDSHSPSSDDEVDMEKEPNIHMVLSVYPQLRSLNILTNEFQDGIDFQDYIDTIDNFSGPDSRRSVMVEYICFLRDKIYKEGGSYKWESEDAVLKLWSHKFEENEDAINRFMKSQDPVEKKNDMVYANVIFAALPLIFIHLAKRYMHNIISEEKQHNTTMYQILLHVREKMILYTKIMIALKNYKDIDFMILSDFNDNIVIENPFSSEKDSGASEWRVAHGIKLEEYEYSKEKMMTYKKTISNGYGTDRDIASLLLILHLTIRSYARHIHTGVEHHVLYRERLQNLIKVVNKESTKIDWLLHLK